MIQPGVPGHSSRRVAPFGHPRIERLLAATRGFSQQRYVLHRLLVPRHPPCALSSLTFLSSLFSDRGSRSTARYRQARHIHTCSPGICCEDSLATPDDGIVRHRFSHADSLFPCEGAGVTAAALARDRWMRLPVAAHIVARAPARPGDGRARTGDPLLAKQVLSQLSYIPGWGAVHSWSWMHERRCKRT